jgi:hypothetical protein
MDMRAGKFGKAAGFGAGALAAALSFVSPSAATAALVTRTAPIQEVKTYSAVPAILQNLPEADPCAARDKAVYALQSSVVEAQAQYWAYLMKRPGFSVSSLRSKPGADIADGDLRDFFYKKLAAWFAEEQVPELAAETVRDINDVSMRVRLIKDACR